MMANDVGKINYTVCSTHTRKIDSSAEEESKLQSKRGKHFKDWNIAQFGFLDQHDSLSLNIYHSINRFERRSLDIEWICPLDIRPREFIIGARKVLRLSLMKWKTDRQTMNPEYQNAIAIKCPPVSERERWSSLTTICLWGWPLALTTSHRAYPTDNIHWAIHWGYPMNDHSTSIQRPFNVHWRQRRCVRVNQFSYLWHFYLP